MKYFLDLNFNYFLITAELSNEELELHVNTAHLDFLTPESDDMQYLENGIGGKDVRFLWIQCTPVNMT